MPFAALFPGAVRMAVSSPSVFTVPSECSLVDVADRGPRTRSSRTSQSPESRLLWFADASALSKVETETIWLAFGVIASSSLALPRSQAATWVLLGCSTWALLVNHLVNTGR